MRAAIASLEVCLAADESVRLERRCGCDGWSNILRASTRPLARPSMGTFGSASMALILSRARQSACRRTTTPSPRSLCPWVASRSNPSARASARPKSSKVSILMSPMRVRGVCRPLRLRKINAAPDLAGLEDLTAGHVVIEGQTVDHVAPAKRGIAMVFQSYALYPHLDVRGNMSLGLKQEGVVASEIERRVDKAAGLLKLEALMARRPSELSGGQRQRVAIGRAIVARAETLPFRRAALQSRCGAARQHQAGDRKAPPRSWCDHDLCHP